MSSLAVAAALGPAAGAMAAPPGDLPPPKPSLNAAAIAAPPAAPCGTKGAPACDRRVVSWGLDCEGEKACEESRTPEERRAYAIVASLLRSAPPAPSPVAREEPQRSGSDSWVTLVAGCLAGLAAGFAAGGRVARRPMPATGPGDGLIRLSIEPPTWGRMKGARSASGR